MALSAADKVNIRRYAGYPLIADTMTNEDSDDAYVYTRRVATTLDARLDSMTAEEEEVLKTIYLDNLSELETGILDSRDSIDTDAAGTWKANRNEMGDRTRLFNKWRRHMCAFIGVEPGPSLASGGNIVRG